MYEDDPTPLVAAYEAGRALYPAVLLEYESYRAVVEKSRGTPPPGEHAADVFLAAACAEGVDEAWSVFRSDVVPRVRAFLLRRSAARQDADSVCETLAGHLWEPPARSAATSRIATYRGDSSLLTWTNVVAWRLLEGQWRAAARGRAERGPTTVADIAPSPLESVIGLEKAERFEVALKHAWRTLTARERLAVLLRYRDGLTQKNVAHLMGVGEPRVSRLIKAGVQRLRAELTRSVRETPPGRSGVDAELWAALREAISKEGATSGPGAL